MDFASALFGQAGNRDASPHDARPCQHAPIDTGPSTSTRAHDASATRCAGWWTATTLPRSSDLQEHAARRYVQATLTLSELKQLASDLAGPCTSMQGQQLHLALADGSNAASGRPTWRRGRSSTRGLRPTPGGASGSAEGRLDLADVPGRQLAPRAPRRWRPRNKNPMQNMGLAQSTWWLWVDSNHRPQHYECCALTG